MTRSAFIFFIFLTFHFFFLHSYAQQLPLASQYIYNGLVLNPAYAGSKEYFSFRITNRNQWVGIKGGPITQTLGADGLLGNGQIGLGGFLINDMIGPSRQMGLQTNYAYHLPISKGKLSIGILAGIFQNNFNPTKVNVIIENDHTLIESAGSEIMPDAGFGLHYYTKKLFAGASALHLVEMRIKSGQLVRHFNIYGGFNLEVNENLSIEPSLLVRMTSTAPTTIDINGKITLMNTIMFGASYRTHDAFVLLLGLKMKNKFQLGYSYDLTFSDLKPYSKGSHEIMFGYDLNNNEKTYLPKDKGKVTSKGKKNIKKKSTHKKKTKKKNSPKRKK